MRVKLADRKKAFMRAFVWLCDECPEGQATVLDMGRTISGTTRGGPLQQVAFVLQRLGWAEITPGPNPARPVVTGSIKVSPYGWLMRDYMKHEHETVHLDRIEMFAQVRALRMLLAPLARAGVKYRKASSAQRDILRIALEPLGLTPLQLDMAAAIIYPERGFDQLVFPWTPGYIAQERRRVLTRGGYADDIARQFESARSRVRHEPASASDRDRPDVHDATASCDERPARMGDDRQVDGAGLPGVAGIDQRHEPSEP